MIKLHQLLVRTIFVLPLFLEIFPAQAFNLVYKYPPDSFNYVNQADYITPAGNKGKVKMEKIKKISPPSSKLLQLFKNQFPAYNFEASYTPIYGDFVVVAYQACPPAPNPGSCYDSGYNVGGLLTLDYVPNKIFDPELGREFNEFPDPLTGKVRWVQWVTNNHKLGVNSQHGDKEAVIDTTSNTPFYYSGSQEYANRRDPYDFYDNPSRVDVGWNHDWLANLYLAYEKIDLTTNVTTVQIFGGIRWGWHNKVDRKKKEPNPVPGLCPANSSSQCPPPPPVCTGGSGGGGCNKTTATNYVNYQDEISPFDLDNINELEDGYLSFLDFDEIAWNSDEEDYWYDHNEYADGNEDNSESPTSVPESTSTLGLLLLSAFVFIKSLIITKD